jgi:hypothetical protein
VSNESRPKRQYSAATKVVLWVAAVAMTLTIAFVAYLAVPMLLGTAAGSSGQVTPEGFPTTVSATGEDGRTRILSASAEDGGSIDLSALTPGDHVVISGTGFDAASGIYVAVCKVPDTADTKPGPCLGGVPKLEPGQEPTPGSVDWAPANWINDDWAWKLFGARSFDDRETGEFTAYVLIPTSADENVDCTVDACGIFTRNDHTELDNRVQDIYLPVSFSE